MARRVNIPIECYEDGPKFKKRWRLRELERLSTPPLRTLSEILEEEREAEEAEQVRRRLHIRRMELAKRVMNRLEYSVFLLDPHGLEDEEIAQQLAIPKVVVQRHRYEGRKKFKAAEAKEKLEKSRKTRKKGK